MNNNDDGCSMPKSKMATLNGKMKREETSCVGVDLMVLLNNGYSNINRFEF